MNSDECLKCSSPICWSRFLCPLIKTANVTLGNQAIRLDRKVYILAETTTGLDSSRVFFYDTCLKKWSTLDCQGDRPPILVKYAADGYGQSIYVFGGMLRNGLTCADLYELQVDERENSCRIGLLSNQNRL
ncbi:hypothetical protein ACOME3_007107 [Neoechinorhynchus agilis]